VAPSEHFSYSRKQRGFFARYGFALGIVVVAAIAAVLVKQVFTGHHDAPRKPQEMVMIRPLAPPPPPPPPPPPQTVPKQRMDDQTQVTEQDMKPAEQPPEDTTPSLGTNIKGSGPGDGFGLGGRDKGYINGSSGGAGAGGRFGGYFTSVVRAVTDALGRNPVTRNASFDVKVKIWSDLTGRIVRVRLADSTGDVAVDEAIRTDALLGSQLPDIPSGMRMPIELRLNLRRPN
jgi:hypothetical protein